MAITVLLHINNEDPVLTEIEALPSPADVTIICKNPRRRDGKDLIYLLANVTTVIWPMSRMNFIEVMPAEDEEKVITHVRE
ncbi:MAG: hypothetical protein HZB20_06000 [Chloroflexi bacterium]|nr:hypothetical protein [Chloroflexota bacterium]